MCEQLTITRQVIKDARSVFVLAPGPVRQKLNNLSVSSNKMSLAGFLRLSIICSMAVSILSLFSTSNPCYTCDFQIIALLFILHIFLFTATYISGKALKFLILTLLVFYVSRVGILQLNLEYFVYGNNLPSVLQMGEVLFVLLSVTAGLLAGCVLGENIAPKKTVGCKMFLFSASIRNERSYYLYLTWIFIFSKIILLYLFIDSGVGIGINLSFFDPVLLRIAKVARMFSFLGIFPVCWLILKKPRGFERKLTIFAIVLFVLATLASGSKTALFYSIIPFILVYFVTGIQIPRAQARFFKWVLVLSILVVFPAMAALRIYMASILAGNPMGFFDVVGTELNIWSIILGFASRVGSSFDVLSFIATAKNEFIPYANLTAEFIDVINGYIIGGLFVVDAPPWARILYALGHNANLDAVIAIGTGENITLPAHLYINFDIYGIFLLSFFVMFMYGMAYNYLNVIFVRVIIINSIIFGISNGSGLVSMLLHIPFLLFHMMVIHLPYKFAHQFMRGKMAKANSNVLRNHNHSTSPVSFPKTATVQK